MLVREKESLVSYCKLTICFEKPFWIGLVETEDDAGIYRVAKHVFGPEPTDPEVCVFIHDHWNELRFTRELQVEKTGGRKMSYKRMQRAIEKEIAANARRGTKAQQALAEEREANKIERTKLTRAEKDAQAQERFAQHTEKRKEKHKGH